VASRQVSLRPLSADAAARMSPMRMRHFSSAPGDFRRQQSVLAKYDAQLPRSRTVPPDLTRRAPQNLNKCTLCHGHQALMSSESVDLPE
jgi:hypothetical protein